MAFVSSSFFRMVVTNRSNDSESAGSLWMTAAVTASMSCLIGSASSLA
jgi:hypothetical protein